jgi:tRNA(Ile)-lysidine synthase
LTKEEEMLLKDVKNTITKYALVKRNDLLIVGVSGGKDSVCLLYLLKALSKELGIEIVVAHFDHMLRKDSKKDAQYVKDLACRLSLPVYISSADINGVKSKRGSVEELARNARFNFLFETAMKLKTNKIALAHTQDDQAETVLMRILRGSGLYGLSAILPKREISGFTVIRPLIETSRADIEAFLRKRGIKTCTDESNFSDIYLRNKLRHKLIPLLEKEYNPKIKEILSNLAQSASFDYDYLNKQALKIIGRRFGRINTQKLLKLHPSMRRLVIRLNIARLQGSTRRITLTHIKEIEDLISSRPVNSVVNLPKGISVIKKAKTISFDLS